MIVVDGDRVAGSPLVGAVRVLGPGSGRAMAGPLLGWLFSRRRASPLRVRETAILAVTAEEVLLMSFIDGGRRPRATGVVARAARRDVGRASVPRALTSNALVLRFVDGSEWCFDVAKPVAGRARHLTRLLDPGTC